MPEPATTYVRRDIWSLSPGDPIITGYASAVKRMRERPEADVTSWAYQAAIHGTHATPNRPEWNACQHGTWFFLPWHRMFLYYFERIVRAAVVAEGGNADWALPYWNYGLGGQSATLPPAFRTPTLAGGSENPLYIAERAPGINSGAGLPAYATSPQKALARPAFIGRAELGGDRTTPAQFSESGGELEETPHNVIHGLVGGRGLMGDILRAAQDPIFWLHHANIDRIWALWSSNSSHQEPGESPWKTQAFSFFDEKGQNATLRCDQVLETISDLGYTYDSSATPPSPPTPTPPAGPTAAMTAPEREMIGASQESIRLTGQPATVAVPIDAQASAAFTPARHAYLNVEEIEGESNPGTGYGVYANLPEHASAEQEAAHHVGNLSFFGIERARNPLGDEPAHNLQSSFEITALARELNAQGQWAGHSLQITFQALTLTPPEEPDEKDPPRSPVDEDLPIRIGRISVFYDA
jgi:tyrosinase